MKSPIGTTFNPLILVWLLFALITGFLISHFLLISYIIIMLSIILITIYLSRHFFGTAFSPWGSYMLSWEVMFGLYLFGLFGLPNILPVTVFAIFLATLMFTIGSLLGSNYKNNKNWLSKKKEPKRNLLFSININFLLKISVILICLSLVGYILFWYKVENNLLLVNVIDNPSILNTESIHGELRSLGIIGRLMRLSIPASVFAMICLVSNRLQSKGIRVSILSTLAFSVGIILNIISVRRGPMFILTLWCLLVLVFLFREVKKRFIDYIKIVTLIFAVFFIFSFSQNLLNKSFVRIVDGTNNCILSWLIDPYIYITGNIATLQNLLKSAKPKLSFGARTFDIYYLFLVKTFPDFFPKIQRGISFLEIPFMFNTSPYLWYVYNDWGWIGIGVFPLIIGFVGAILWQLYRYKPSLLNLLIVSLYCCAMVLSVRDNLFGKYDPIYFVFVSFIVAKLHDRLCWKKLRSCY